MDLRFTISTTQTNDLVICSSGMGDVAAGGKPRVAKGAADGKIAAGGN